MIAKNQADKDASLEESNRLETFLALLQLIYTVLINILLYTSILICPLIVWLMIY